MNWNTVILYATEGNPNPPKTVIKSEEEWKSILTEEEYNVTRNHGTEMPGSGSYCTAFDPGIYACKCCNTRLFDSNTKFESGTGWPSFSSPLSDNVIQYSVDSSLIGRDRIETRCNICQAHLGHVFPDGPEPSGLRYCMNSIALIKVD